MDAEDPVWHDTADESVLARLDPGADPALERRPDVLVVGGGIVGLATAALCRRAGLGRVVLIERERLAAGASGRAAALLTPEPHVWTDPPAFVTLARASLQLLRTLDQEWGGTLGVEPLDWMVALDEPVPLDADLGAEVEVLDADRAHELEPELGELGGALRIAGQARVHPLGMASVMAARAGTVATGVEMAGIETRKGLVTAVHTSLGDFCPGVVVFATGTAPRLPGLNLAQQWIKGHLLATDRAPFRLRSALATRAGLVFQLPEGHIVAGGTLDEGDDEPLVRPDVIAEIRAGLGMLVPRAQSLAITHSWCCFRPTTFDRQPVIDLVPGLENAWVTCGHFRTGILMAAAVGDAIARWITTRVVPAGVRAFSIDRLGVK